MAIKPRREIEATENKCFHAEITVNFDPISYNSLNVTNELSTELCYNHIVGISRNDANDTFLEDQLQNPSEKHPISIAEFFGSTSFW